MRSRRHVLQVDRIWIFAISNRTIASVVSEAVLDAYDDPLLLSAPETVVHPHPLILTIDS